MIAVVVVVIIIISAACSVEKNKKTSHRSVSNTPRTDGYTPITPDNGDGNSETPGSGDYALVTPSEI